MARRPTSSAPPLAEKASPAALRVVRPATRWAVDSRRVPLASDWDAADVLSALRSHADGQFRASALLADWITQSDAVAAPLDALRRSVLGLPFRVDPAPLVAPEDTERATELAGALARAWGKIAPRGVVAEVLRWVALMGFAVCERRWRLDPRAGRWTFALKVWHPSYVRYDWPTERFVVSTTAGEEAIEPGSSRWFVVQDLDASRPWMSGGVRPLAVLALIAWWLDRDGARWAERHGLPPIGAKVPLSEWDSPKTDAFLLELEQLGTEPIVRLPQDETGHGFDLEWKELKNQEAWKGFLEGHRDLRARAATVLLGQPLSTQAGVGGSGSYALGRVHAQVRQDVIESYVGVLGTLREHASRWLTWVNDEPDPARAEDLAPAPVWDAAIPTDTNAVALGQRARAEAVAAWRAAGVDVDAEAEARACGMTVREAPRAQP